MKSAAATYEVFVLHGGLDLVTPTTSLRPGVARDAVNFEVSVAGGISRINGYERYDGRVAWPSLAAYRALQVNAIGSITVGSTIDNGAGGTGYVFAIDGNTVFYTIAVGTIPVGNVLTAGPTVTSVTVVQSAANGPVRTAQAAMVYRNLILVVPGSGSVLGVEVLNSVLYAWRANAGNTAIELYRQTTGGWSLVSYGFEVAFQNGSVAPAIGGVITQGANTATVRQICLESGSWAGLNARGRFITSAAPAPGAFTAAALTAGATANLWAGLTGGLVQAAITFPVTAAARVQTVVGTFGGGSTQRIYGCDGKNRAFEFDGTTMSPIRTGMTTDTPTNIAIHKNYLFLSFGASLQFSALASPFTWTPLLGAGELVLDGDVNCLQPMTGNQLTSSLGIYTANRMSILYGSIFSGAGADAQLVPYGLGFGAEKYTAQNLEQTYALDSRGVVSLAAAQEFGNFETATVTFPVRPFIAAKRGLSVASGTNQEKSQYRVFYSDGTGLYLTIVNGQFKGAMPVALGHVPTCWCKAPAVTGLSEASYIGTTSGYVMRMDTGNTFDGGAVQFRLVLNFDAMGNPRILKRMRKAALEVFATGYTSFYAGYSLSYADPTVRDQPASAAYSANFLQANWDASVSWDAVGVYWDSQQLGPVEVELQGAGENIAMSFQGSTDAYGPFTINSVTIHYTPRRGMR